MKPTKETIIRTAVLLLAFINAGLALFNKSPLPISDDTINNVVTFIFLGVAAWRAWWKNNSFTADALKADELLKSLKAEK